MPPNEPRINHHDQGHSHNSHQLRNSRRVHWHKRHPHNAVVASQTRTTHKIGPLLVLAIVLIAGGLYFGGKTVVSNITSSSKNVQPQSPLQQTGLSGIDSGNDLTIQQYDVSSTLPSKNCPSLASRENTAFWYQAVNAGDIDKFGCPRALVGNWDWTPQNIADIKQSTGTEVYSYLEMFWLPTSGQFDGFDLSSTPGWQFCSSGSTPMLGNYTGSAHPNWYYVDLNSTAVVNAYKAYLLAQKAKGFDGVFLDTGGQAMVYGKIWDKKSTCTKDPISTERTAGDAFAKLVNAAHSVGMKTFVNIGVSPDLNVPKFRPNPRRADCVAGQTSCVPMNDVLTNADYVLNEGASNLYDASGWQHNIDQLYSDQNTPMNSARSHAIVVAMGRYDGPLDSTRDAHILYQWATMKLYDVAVNFGTGDDNGGGNRHGIAPVALTNSMLGSPLAVWGKPGFIGGTDKLNGIWYRRYQNGIIIVNNTSITRVTGSLPIFDNGTCKYLRTQPTNRLIAAGNCVKSINRSLKPYTAEVLTYSSSAQ